MLDAGLGLSATDDAEVVLIGRQGAARISLAEVCAAQGATPRRVGPALSRIWHAMRD